MIEGLDRVFVERKKYVILGYTAAVREAMVGPIEWRFGRIRYLRLSNKGYIKAVDLVTECGTIASPVRDLVILPTN